MAPHGGLAEVLRRFGPAYCAAHTLSAPQAKAWRAILACRTPELGGHVECCDHCGAQRHVYHSCRNRHCPQCQTRAKEAWRAARQRELLPVPYFHLVFTLPHALNGSIGHHARLIYETLFGTASAMLTEFAANPRWLGGAPAFTLVLHTWKQDLGRHVHVHALVAGGALTTDGRWLSPKRGFLFPVKALSKVFRAKFIAALAAEREAGQLREEASLGEAPWRELLGQLRAHNWVVYAKAPLGGPAAVLGYLARYTHRVAISNERILAIFDRSRLPGTRRHEREETHRPRRPGSSLHPAQGAAARQGAACARGPEGTTAPARSASSWTLAVRFRAPGPSGTPRSPPTHYADRLTRHAARLQSP